MSHIPTRPWLLALVAMVLIISLSNVAVTKAVFPTTHPWHFYFNWAQFSFPLAFLVTDLVNRLLGAEPARRLAYLAFFIAIPISILATRFSGEVWVLALRIGLASGLAFLVGQLLDISLFQRLRRLTWWIAPLASSLFASLVDTWIFYSAAFAGGGEAWWITQAWIDYGVKVGVAFLALLPFRLVVARRLA